MITLPPQYIATKFPGYFWNVNQQALYSIKVSGVLTRLKHTKPSIFTHWNSGYRVSVNGRRMWLSDQYLTNLKPHNSVIPEK